MEVALLAVLAVIYMGLAKSGRSGSGMRGWWQAWAQFPRRGHVRRAPSVPDGAQPKRWFAGWPRDRADERDRAPEQEEAEAVVPAEAEEVAQLLDEMYQEFMEEIRRLREDTARALARLQQEMREMTAKALCEAQASAARQSESPASPHPPGSTGSASPDVTSPAETNFPLSSRYQAVAEQLAEGKRPQEVAMALGMSVTEVELVRELLALARVAGSPNRMV